MCWLTLPAFFIKIRRGHHLTVLISQIFLNCWLFTVFGVGLKYLHINFIVGGSKRIGYSTSIGYNTTIAYISDGGIDRRMFCSFIEWLSNINFWFGWIEVMLFVKITTPGVRLLIKVRRSITIQITHQWITIYLTVVHAEYYRFNGTIIWL